MSQPYLGQIIAAGFNFPPVGWATCDGSVLPISQYDALYTLLGTTYGGDGINTFGLPDLRGRTPLCAGNGQGLQPYVQGQSAGVENVGLVSGQIAAHSHTVVVQTAPGASAVPANNLVLASQGPAGGSPPVVAYGAYNAANQTTLSSATVGPAGQGVPHENRQPYLTLNYIICLEGLYPSPG